MVKKKSLKAAVFFSAAAIAFCTMFFPVQQTKAAEMPSLLEGCVEAMGSSPSVETLWDTYPYVKEYLGEFSATAYCGCASCNGEWYGYPAANGEALQNGLTIAVDPSVIPLGTYVIIEGVGIRKAQDTGSAIKGQDVDIYVSSHSECSDWGRRSLRVWMIPDDVMEALFRMSNGNYAEMAEEEKF